MSEKQKVKYRLFALPVSEESMAEAEKKRFSRITAKYVLIYCDSETENAMHPTVISRMGRRTNHFIGSAAPL